MSGVLAALFVALVFSHPAVFRLPAIWGRLALAALSLGASLPAAAQPAPRVVTAFDTDWRFLQQDAPAAAQAAFDDAKWQPVTVPHDWSIAGPYDQAAPTGRGGGYLPAGVGWYRKHFVLPETDRARRVVVEFDGVMANSEVWLNGVKLGQRPYGYSSFRYDLTGHLN